jgi:hypothetical protein
MSETVGVERGFAPGELAWQRAVVVDHYGKPRVVWGWQPVVRPPFTERKP